MTQLSSAMIIKPPRYLVCVDYRSESKTALRLACMKAKARGGSVSMVHVIAPEDFHTFGSVSDRMKEEKRAEAETLLRQPHNQDAGLGHPCFPPCSVHEWRLQSSVSMLLPSDSIRWRLCFPTTAAHKVPLPFSLISFLTPHRLAWCLTVHKVQGASIDFLEVDLEGCFEFGQAYVALSRARSAGGLR